MGHIFPVTDKRHVVITPSLILLGQIIGQSPIRSLKDLTRGIFCSSLMIEYTKEAKRLPTEALSFLAGVINLYSDATDTSSKSPVPSFSSASKVNAIKDLRRNMIENFDDETAYCLSLEREKMNSKSAPVAIFSATLQLVKKSVEYYCTSMGDAQIEVFHQITKALLNLNPGNKSNRFPEALAKEVRNTAEVLHVNLKIGEARVPLTRRTAAKSSELAIKTLAPRMEDPDKYSMSKDKNKTSMQSDRDKVRRELKREHKAASRELRLDAAFIEAERRKQKDLSDSKARDARNKNHAWLEQEQATMNQQVALGGGLLKGGGIGAARGKAATGRLGIKKGGKIR
jgi:nucleolar protein 14